MHLIIQRTNSNYKRTLGEVTGIIDDRIAFSAFSVENPWLDNEPYTSSIPPGTYQAFIRRYSCGKEVIQLENVPDRSGIQIHVGNLPEELEGCIAIGWSKNNEGVDNSLDAMSTLLDIAPDRLTVEVLDPFATKLHSVERSDDFLDKVYIGNSMEASKSIARKKARRSLYKRAGIAVLNLTISFTAKALGIPELKNLRVDR